MINCDAGVELMGREKYASRLVENKHDIFKQTPCAISVLIKLPICCKKLLPNKGLWELKVNGQERQIGNLGTNWEASFLTLVPTLVWSHQKMGERQNEEHGEEYICLGP